jgi:AraC-like DNA-binding protein
MGWAGGSTVQQIDDSNIAGAALSDDIAAPVVRIDALRCFNEGVITLGGDPGALMAPTLIKPELLANRTAVLPYRALVHLLERCASELNCPDFGLRLAAAQGGAKVLGPLEVAMRNSASLADAFRYCAEHVQAYSPAARISLESRAGTSCTFLRFDILLSHLPYQRQAVEQALLLTQHAAQSISGGNSSACEVLFCHEPIAPMTIYRARFNTVVRFGQSCNGLLFHNCDLNRPINNPDPQLYELATSFIDTRFPCTNTAMAARVRAMVSELLVSDRCTNIQVARALGLHPRTLQRRLREEGESFEAIRDSVRRDIALRYLPQRDVPLIKVAEMLGYSEASVLSRSCYRWFSASPRQLRKRFNQAA